ncbi:MAG: hypothetical protein QM689_12210 [Oscillospiraceae bacterium]
MKRNAKGRIAGAFTIVAAAAIAASGLSFSAVAQRLLPADSETLVNRAGAITLGFADTAPVLYPWSDYRESDTQAFSDAVVSDKIAAYVKLLYGEDIGTLLNRLIGEGLSAVAQWAPADSADYSAAMRVNVDTQGYYLKDFAYQNTTGQEMVLDFAMENAVVVYFRVHEKDAVLPAFTDAEIQTQEDRFDGVYESFLIAAKSVKTDYVPGKSDIDAIFKADNPVSALWRTQRPFYYSGFFSELPVLFAEQDAEVFASEGLLYRSAYYDSVAINKANPWANVTDAEMNDDEAQAYETDGVQNDFYSVPSGSMRLITIYNPVTGIAEGFSLQME